MAERLGTRGSFDWLLVFAGVMALLVLRMDLSWYENDGHFIVHRLIGGEPVQPRHWLLETALGPFSSMGIDVAWTARLVSACGVAVACALVNASAIALGYSRIAALFAGFAFGATGFSMLFGTVVEFHGMFAALAALAMFLSIRTSVAGSSKTLFALAITTGLASGFAAFAHATGQVLPGLLCLIVLASKVRFRTALVACVAIVGAHAGTAFVVPKLFTAIDGYARDAQQSADYLAAHFGAIADEGVTALLRDMGAVTWREWLVPYCSVSVLWLFAVGREGAIRLVIPFVLFFLGQLVLARLLLGGEGSVMHESGAYLVPSGWMAALIAARALPRDGRLALWIGAALLAAGLFVGLDHRRDRGVTEERFVERAALFDAHLNEDALIWTQDLTSIGALLDRRPRSGFFITHALAPLGEAGIVANLGALLTKLETDLKGGRQLALTGSALDYLENRLPGGPQILKTLSLRLKSSDVGDGDAKLRIYRLE